LNFYNKNVFYLPLNIPEDIIWDENFAKTLLNIFQPKKDISEIVTNSNNSKDLLFNFCKECYGQNQYESTILQFTMNWLNKEDENYIYIKDLINKLKN
jgi:hypothetical protein